MKFNEFCKLCRMGNGVKAWVDTIEVKCEGEFVLYHWDNESHSWKGIGEDISPLEANAAEVVGVFSLGRLIVSLDLTR